MFVQINEKTWVNVNLVEGFVIDNKDFKILMTGGREHLKGDLAFYQKFLDAIIKLSKFYTK